VQYVLERQPQATLYDIRARLAQFRIRGPLAHRPWSQLSGGERFRVAMAALLLAEPANELLILDEPTNHMDTDSVRQLRLALAAGRGAMLVVSHDRDFLCGLGIDLWIEMTPEGMATSDLRPLR
jgi:ATPase subunit of ABC transporter with duplicated ATPase domains